MLQPGTRHHRRGAVSGGQRRAGIAQAQQVGVDGVQGVRQLQHGAGIDDVLAGGAPMDVAASLGIAPRHGGGQLLHERDGEVAAGHGGLREGVEVNHAGIGTDFGDDGSGLRGNHAAVRLGAREGRLGIEHAPHRAGIGEDREHGGTAEHRIGQAGNRGHRRRGRTGGKAPIVRQNASRRARRAGVRYRRTRFRPRPAAPRSSGRCRGPSPRQPAWRGARTAPGRARCRWRWRRLHRRSTAAWPRA
ncbi:hypothetical protein D3C86_1073650 [compost metagenome]